MQALQVLSNCLQDVDSMQVSLSSNIPYFCMNLDRLSNTLQCTINCPSQSVVRERNCGTTPNRICMNVDLVDPGTVSGGEGKKLAKKIGRECSLLLFFVKFLPCRLGLRG